MSRKRTGTKGTVVQIEVIAISMAKSFQGLRTLPFSWFSRETPSQMEISLMVQMPLTKE